MKAHRIAGPGIRGRLLCGFALAALIGCSAPDDDPPRPGSGVEVPAVGAPGVEAPDPGGDSAARVGSAQEIADRTTPSQERSDTTAPAPGAADPSTPPQDTTPSAGPAADSAANPTPTEPPVARAPSALDSLTALVATLAVGQVALQSRLDSVSRQLADRRAGAEAAPPPGDAGQVLDEAREQAQNFGYRALWSLITIVVFSYLIRLLAWVFDTLAERSARRRLFYKRIVPIARIVLWAFAAYLIISVIFRVDGQGILAAAAAVGVAIGFAAQDLLKNLFGGLILVFDRPFQVGDKISVGGTYGEVTSIGLRSTRIVTPDDNLVSVPNHQVVDGQVANANAGELNCQVVTELFLPGFVDEARAKRIAFDAAASSKYVYLRKPIVVLVKDTFKETFLTQLKVKAYVLDPRYEFQFQSDVTERARAGFREAGLINPGHALRAYLDLSRVDPEPGGAQGVSGDDPDA